MENPDDLEDAKKCARDFIDLINKWHAEGISPKIALASVSATIDSIMKLAQNVPYEEI